MDQDDPDFSHDPSFSPDDPGFFAEVIQVFITPKNSFGKESKMATKKARGNSKAAITDRLRAEGHKGLAILAENHTLTGQQARRLAEMGKLIVSGTDVADALSMLTAQFGDDLIDAWALLRLGTEKDTGRSPVALVLAKRILALTDPESAEMLITELIAHAGIGKILVSASDVHQALLTIESHFDLHRMERWAFNQLFFDESHSWDKEARAFAQRLSARMAPEHVRELADTLIKAADQAQAEAKGDGQ